MSGERLARVRLVAQPDTVWTAEAWTDTVGKAVPVRIGAPGSPGGTRVVESVCRAVDVTDDGRAALFTLLVFEDTAPVLGMIVEPSEVLDQGFDS